MLHLIGFLFFGGGIILLLVSGQFLLLFSLVFWIVGIHIFLLLAKDLNDNIYILDSDEFQLESRNLINEILNTAARDKSDVQYIELDRSIGKNFGLLIIDELNRRGFITGTGNSRENKVDRARRVSADIQKKGVFLVGKDSTGFTKKWAMEFLEKITSYPNETIHDDCVVPFYWQLGKKVAQASKKLGKTPNFLKINKIR